MVDMALLQGAVTGLKTAADIAIGMSKLKTMAEVNAKAIELQQVILSAQSNALGAQSAQFSLIEEIRSLKEEIAQVKAWEETKKNYLLVSPWTGCFVYALKKQSGSIEPTHWLCPNCYQNGKKFILQKAREDNRMMVSFGCHNCNSKLLVRGGYDIQVSYAEDTTPQAV
ncbi:hypothetical protein [Collimonas fungivorans]|uniref:hypothetical protein n=1 Tax=Collimonas fungivorans TaxID=158899 RepID=UPI00068272D7|nr:hypothetical protein [Collimonas fungivorans]